MQIDFDNINVDDFNISEREHSVLGSVILIGPKPGKHFWEFNELHLRSLLCRPDGTIICSGFPKFMNYGERSELDAITARGIMEGRAHFAEKMDGSLIVRTVIGDYVSFRTRGCHNLGDFEDSVMRLVTDSYPRLLEPDFFRHETSMLFEFTSPENKIILDYDEPALTVLGTMSLPTTRREILVPRFNSHPEHVSSISQLTGVNTPEFYQLPSNIDELIAAVNGWSNAEGVVVWIRESEGSMHLAKIKAAEYVRIHSLKYHMSGEKLRKICHAADITSEQDLQEQLFEWGLDWECSSILLPEFNEYRSNREAIRQEVADFIASLDASGIAKLPTRKRAVLAMRDLTGKDKSLFNIGINHLFGDPERVQRAILARELGLSRNAVTHWEESAQLLLEAVTARFNGEFDVENYEEEE